VYPVDIERLIGAVKNAMYWQNQPDQKLAS
jgi:2-aminoethylphosphonate-pyruvate transaminase